MSKRELAALDTDTSLLSRKTRSGKPQQVSANGVGVEGDSESGEGRVPERLVYKRLRRSNSKVVTPPAPVPDVVDDLSATPPVCDGVVADVVSEKDGVSGGVGVEKGSSGDEGVRGEGDVAMVDAEENRGEASSRCEEAVENGGEVRYSAVENGGVTLEELVKEVEVLAEGVGNVGDVSMDEAEENRCEASSLVVENGEAANDDVAKCLVVENGEANGDVAKCLVVENGEANDDVANCLVVENGEVKAEELVQEVGVSAEVDAGGSELGKNVESDGAEANVNAMEECERKDERVVIDSNLGNGEVDKDKVVEEVLSKSFVRKGKGKKTGVVMFQRRFTRSALKPEPTVEETVVKENLKEVKAEEVVKSEDNTVVDIVVQDDREVKEDLTKEEEVAIVTTVPLAKTKEDGTDSCLTETSDSVVMLDKENAGPGVSNENGECDMEIQVVDSETMSMSIPVTPVRRTAKQIALSSYPTTVRDLFETGLLEGCPVYYDGGKGPGLRGRIRSIGILCPCNLCRGGKVIPPSMFEIHANNSYKRAVQYIYLENGRSFIQILNACRSKRVRNVEQTIRNAIGPLPERTIVYCLNCQEPYPTLDAECSEPVCSPCIVSNVSPIGPVYSCRRVISSSKYASVDASRGMLQARGMDKSALKDGRQGKSSKKSTKRSLMPKVRSSSRIGKTSETKLSEKIANNLQVVPLEPKTYSSILVRKSSPTKTPKKLVKKSLGAALSPKPSGSLQKDASVKATKRLRKEVLTPKSLKIPSVNHTSEKKTSGKITRKVIGLHKLVFEDDVLPDGTELGYYVRGQKLLDGFKQGSGIFCNCCDTVVSASQFEAHAGCASRRKPYCYIYTSNGVSLHELSVTLIKGRQHSEQYNDDLCSICADGGSLVLCDACPRAFHKECASLSSLPRGKWYCKYCESMFEREKFVAHNANAVAAGRVSGVDPMEQITERSIRIVNNVGSEVSSCILCRGHDFCKSGFGPRTIILCDQCEKEYHVGCLRDHDMADLKELPDGNWFCSMHCGRIDSTLQNALVQGAEKLPDKLVNIIMRKNFQSAPESGTDLDISWRLLSGKIASPETRPLLSQAVAIFHESFAPIIDVVSGHDLIPAMVYGRNVGGQEFSGMYCAVLTINSVVVSAGIFRVFGSEVAELPLVATSSGNHGKGYFQTLFACIERLLTFLEVKSFVLPAAKESESIWTDRFGFSKMTPEQLRELKQNFWSMVRFEGTSMLHKSVPECEVIPTPSEFMQIVPYDGASNISR